MIKQILVPVDFSAAACAAARYAVEEIAPQLGAAVTFVTVLEVSDLRVAMSAGLHGFEDDEDVRQKVSAWIEAQFARIESPAGAVKATRDVRRGLPERELLEAIQEHAADLIVMGTQGITRRLPIGSKAQYVLKHTRVPVLLVRGEEE
jgi:nucleotide-binding universal stress UspA family protein